MDQIETKNSLGFFGVATRSAATSTNPAGIQDPELKDQIETAKKEMDELDVINGVRLSDAQRSVEQAI